MWHYYTRIHIVTEGTLYTLYDAHRIRFRGRTFNENINIEKIQQSFDQYKVILCNTLSYEHNTIL